MSANVACVIEWTTLLGYLKVLASWPVIGGALIFWSLRKFSIEINGLIGRVQSAKGFGVQFSAGQPPSLPVVEVPASPEIEQTDLEALRLTGEQVRQVRSWLESENKAATIWEYRYLNYFLASSTQFILNWLVTIGRDTTRSEYDAAWTIGVPSADDRSNTLSALNAHGLIELSGQTIHLTPKGIDYSKWIERVVKLPSGA